MSRSPRAGATVIEVLVGMLLAIMVLGILVALTWNVRSGFTRSEDRLDARERAHITLTALRLAIQDSWHYTIAPASTAITFEGPRGSGEVRLDDVTHVLLARLPGEKRPTPLTGPVVGDFRIDALRPGYLRAAITVMRPGNGQANRLAALHVTQELLLPCIAFRSRRIPWVRVLEPAQALMPSR